MGPASVTCSLDIYRAVQLFSLDLLVSNVEYCLDGMTVVLQSYDFETQRDVSRLPLIASARLANMRLLSCTTNKIDRQDQGQGARRPY